MKYHLKMGAGYSEGQKYLRLVKRINESAIFDNHKNVSAFVKGEKDFVTDHKELVDILRDILEEVEAKHWVDIHDHIKETEDKIKQELYAKNREEAMKWYNTLSVTEKMYIEILKPCVAPSGSGPIG